LYSLSKNPAIPSSGGVGKAADLTCWWCICRGSEVFFFEQGNTLLIFIWVRIHYRYRYKQRKERGYKQKKLLQHTDAGASSIFAVAEMENARADHTQALKKPLAKRR
jgi:hypothetical protein